MYPTRTGIQCTHTDTIIINYIHVYRNAFHSLCVCFGDRCLSVCTFSSGNYLLFNSNMLLLLIAKLNMPSYIIFENEHIFH